MKHSYILIAAAASLMLGSCSIISPKGKTVSGSDGIVKEKKENYIKPEKVRPNDAAGLIAGEWIIVSASGKQIPTTDEMPYITFEKATGRFYASDGCNIVNGAYKLDADNTITFANTISTMKYCSDLGYDTLIASALSGSEALTFKIDNIGHESFIRLYNKKGTEIMSARKHNMDFLNGNWQITSVGGKNVDNDEATMFIDINELKIHGNTGCNYFNGQLYINPDKSNAIDFSNIASTRMACPNMEQESAILLSLEETATAIQGSEDRVMLLSQSGKELISLRRIPATEE